MKRTEFQFITISKENLLLKLSNHSKQDLILSQQWRKIFNILADFQLDRLIEEKILNISHLEDLYKLCLEYPDFVASLYAICCLKQ